MYTRVTFAAVFGFILLCHPGHADDKDKEPPKIFPTDTSSFRIIPKNESLLHHAPETTPPHIFPEKGSNYTFINNSSILATLKSHANQTETSTDSEVKDLLESHDAELVPGVVFHNRTHEEKDSTSTPANEEPDMQAENVQQDASKTEDARHNLTGLARQVNVHARHSHASRGGLPVYEGQTAAIVAAVFAAVAILGYACLLIWRRYLEQRYGTREMLINEEEFHSYNDMKNFEL